MSNASPSLRQSITTRRMLTRVAASDVTLLDLRGVSTTHGRRPEACPTRQLLEWNTQCRSTLTERGDDTARVTHAAPLTQQDQSARFACIVVTERAP